MIKPLQAGENAPEFSLPDQDGEIVSSKDFKGQRVLIYFYPKAMTPGCTVQACNLRDNFEEFEKYQVAIIGISTDKSEKLYRFVEKELLNFILLSDEEHKVAQGIHRISFLIDQHGKIEHVFDDFKTNNHHEVVLKYLRG